MAKIKFIEDFTFVVNGELVLAQKNTIVDYIDKYESEATEDACGVCSSYYQWYYRINIDDLIFAVPGSAVVEIKDNEIQNRDYTDKEWRDKATEDALVTDGNYVKAWRDTFGIDKPVKDRADQADYSGRYLSVYDKAGKE